MVQEGSSVSRTLESPTRLTRCAKLLFVLTAMLAGANAADKASLPTREPFILPNLLTLDSDSYQHLHRPWPADFEAAIVALAAGGGTNPVVGWANYASGRVCDAAPVGWCGRTERKLLRMAANGSEPAMLSLAFWLSGCIGSNGVELAGELASRALLSSPDGATALAGGFRFPGKHSATYSKDMVLDVIECGAEGTDIPGVAAVHAWVEAESAALSLADPSCPELDAVRRRSAQAFQRAHAALTASGGRAGGSSHTMPTLRASLEASHAIVLHTALATLWRGRRGIGGMTAAAVLSEQNSRSVLAALTARRKGWSLLHRAAAAGATAHVAVLLHFARLAGGDDFVGTMLDQRLGSGQV